MEPARAATAGELSSSWLGGCAGLMFAVLRAEGSWVNQVVQRKGITDLVPFPGVAVRDLACKHGLGRRVSEWLMCKEIGVTAATVAGASIAEGAALCADAISHPTQRTGVAGADSDLTQSFADAEPVGLVDQMSVGGHRQRKSRDAV